MTAPDIRVRIIGEDQVTPVVRQVAGSATQGLSPVQKFAKALTLSEAHEGTRSLRLLRGGLSELAAQTAGLSGPFAKLGESLLGFGEGGLITLGVVAGIGAIALAIRALNIDAADAAQKQKELEQALDSLGAHGKITADRLRIADLQRQLSDPTFVERLKSLGSAFIGPVFGGQSIDQQRGEMLSEIARLRTEIAREGQELEKPEDAARRHAALGREQALARARALGLSGSPEVPNTGMEELLRRIELVYEKIPPAIAAEIAARERATAEITLTSNSLHTALGSQEDARTRRALLFAPERDVTRTLRIKALTDAGVAPAAAEDIANRERGAAGENQMTEFLRSRLPASLVSTIQGARGGFRSALSSTVNTASGLVAGLPGLGPFDAAAIQGGGAILSHIISLFGSGKAKVTISDFDQQAIDKMRQVNNQPITASYTILNANDPRRIQYDQGRMLSRGVISRGP